MTAPKPLYPAGLLEKHPRLRTEAEVRAATELAVLDFESPDGSVRRIAIMLPEAPVEKEKTGE